MQGNQVALSQKFIQRHIGHKVQLRIGVNVIGNYFHAKSMADSCHGCSYFSGSHNSRCFPVKICALHSAQTEVIFPYTHISFMNPAIRSQCQCHGMFCHCFGRISRHSHHFHPTRFGFLNIYIIKTGTAHEYQFYSAGMKYINGLCSHITAHKCADCIITLCQRGGTGG